MDVIGNGLQGLEVGDLVQGVTGLLQQGLVDDDAEGLVAVADGQTVSPSSPFRLKSSVVISLYDVGAVQIARQYSP